jgi:TolB protein
MRTDRVKTRDRSTAARVIVVLALLGAGLAGVTAPVEAAFPGANGKIAFASSRDGNFEIYVMNADGTGETNLTNNAATDSQPAFSPDGTKIAFMSARDGNDEIYVMNADGTGQTNLTNNAATDSQPAFSPDGTKIAFVSDRDGNDEIYVMNADGTGQTNLTNNAATDSEPAFSPDGTKIAFRSDRDSNFEVYVMNADGTGQANLTNNAAVDSNPAFSPDGTKIAFTSSRDGNSEIYVMNADGTIQARLTNNAATDGQPAFSPDGTKIAFTSTRDGHAEIYVMNGNGTAPMNLTNNAPTDSDPLAADAEPDWQPLSGATGDSATQTASFTIEELPQGVLAISVVDTSVSFGSLTPGASAQAQVGDVLYENTLASGASWSAAVAATSFTAGSNVVPFSALGFVPGSQITGGSGTPPSPGIGGTFSGTDTEPGTSFSDPITTATAPADAQGTFTHAGSEADLQTPSGTGPGTYTATLQYTITG